MLILYIFAKMKRNRF